MFNRQPQQTRIRATATTDAQGRMVMITRFTSMYGETYDVYHLPVREKVIGRYTIREWCISGHWYTTCGSEVSKNPFQKTCQLVENIVRTSKHG